uniref:G_PROTEIN_RECEP_F1_2 domain-containing protein n=1 Tax=Bursaphelenchus xylophilus TaxID=6326 RepID=A0A1I7SUU2_BURXY
MDDLNPKYPAILLATFAAFGIFGNLNILAATLRRSSLRTTCNCLIAIAAAMDIAHVFSQHLMTFFVFSGKHPTLERCFVVQFLPMIGCNAGEILMFLTSLDRLYCVAKPIAYQKIPRAVEVSLCAVISLAFSLWLNLEAYQSLQPIKDQDTLCSVASSFTGRAQNLFTAANGVLNLLTLLNYCAIWIVVKRITRQRSSSLLRSIAAVAFCVVGGWLLTFGMLAGCVVSGMDIQEALLLYLGLPVNLSVSLNYPIYFVMSTQYRHAFKQQLKILSFGRMYKDIGADSTNVASATKTTKTHRIGNKQPFSSTAGL